MINFLAFNAFSAPSCKNFLIGVDALMEFVFESLKLIDRAEAVLERSINTYGIEKRVIDPILAEKLFERSLAHEDEKEMYKVFQQLANIFNGSAHANTYSRFNKLVHNRSQKE